MKATFLKGVVLGAAVSSVTLIASAAFAGNGIGGVFNLGTTNTVNAPTQLRGSVNTGQLQVVNTNGGSGATGIGISTAKGHAPLAVSSNTKVKNLNADLLDGWDSSSLQRKVSGHCGSNTAISGISGSGSASCTKSAVLPVLAEIAPGNQQTFVFGAHGELTLTVLCDTTNGLTYRFVNTGSATGALNWWYYYYQGINGPYTSLSGRSMAVNDTQDFVSNPRLEGQFIFGVGSALATFKLHGFYAPPLLRYPGNCDAEGTAEVTTVS